MTVVSIIDYIAGEGKFTGLHFSSHYLPELPSDIMILGMKGVPQASDLRDPYWLGIKPAFRVELLLRGLGWRRIHQVLCQRAGHGLYQFIEGPSTFRVDGLDLFRL